MITAVTLSKITKHTERMEHTATESSYTNSGDNMWEVNRKGEEEYKLAWVSTVL